MHMAQLMPLPLTVSCFSKIQIGLTFLVPAQPGSPRQKAVKRVYVCIFIRWRYIGQVVVSNVGDNSVSGYCLHAYETQQLSYVPMADATPICYCVELLGSSRQPITGRLATHLSNTTVKIQTLSYKAMF